MQAREPALNVIKFAQIPGTDTAAFGIFSQRSGLKNKTVQIMNHDRDWTDESENEN